MGSSTAQGPAASRASDATGIAFGLGVQPRRPGLRVISRLNTQHPRHLRWRYDPHAPLPTLAARPCGRTTMARGRFGPLLPHRMALSSTTLRQLLAHHPQSPPIRRSSSCAPRYFAVPISTLYSAASFSEELEYGRVSCGRSINVSRAVSSTCRPLLAKNLVFTSSLNT